jgi:WD40 repeat protein
MCGKTAGWILAAAWIAVAQAPDKPVLRIETGMHSAAVKRVAVDPAERYMVSGAEDKTIRIWDLATGRLIRTLRPPISQGNEGKIFAVAISPDGRTIAGGGFTGPAGKANPIYVFDLDTGTMIRRIPGLPNVIHNLGYSKDGKFLAAALGGGNGIRVYRTTDYALVSEDKDYGERSQDLDFSPNLPLRLVSSSYDGLMRLYSVGPDGSLRLLAKQRASGGKRPFGIRFSPDGRSIAVGFDDTAVVNVLSAADLSLQFSPDTSRMSGDLVTTAWSKDGRFLYAGGTYGAGGSPAVRWANGGRGTRDEFRTADDTLMGLTALRNGAIAFVSGDPAVGLVAPDGKQAWFHGPPLAIYRGLANGFQLSRDATRVAFAYLLDGRSPAWFSLRERSLKPEQFPAAQGAMPPVTQGLPITDWKNDLSPKLSGKSLPLSEYEQSRCLAVAPDKRSFLLGADWNLRRFDAAGKPSWKIPIPEVAWGAHISGDGKLAVAALGDGTIRWYRYDTGAELLAFYPHPDRRRWVLWSPSGYYDASPGAEDLIGWHVNRGPDTAADFFPASRFRSTYYRPDVVARILDTLDEAQALRLADADSGRRQQQDSITRVLPPVISLISPADGGTFSTGSVTVRYSVRSPSGEPVTGVRALVDGRPLPATRRVVPAVFNDRAQEMQVEVPNRDCTISLIAENRFAASEPASVHLRWQGRPVPFIIQPKLYILAVGISAYRKPYTLSFPAKDARDFVNALLPQKGKLYRDIESRLITDDKATKEAILDGLDWLEKSATQHDVAMVFLSGHGDNEQRSSTYFFMPINFNPERLKATAIAQSDILSTLQNLPGKALFFVDTCHSGNVLGGRARTLGSDLNALVNELAAAENGAVVFAASSGKQVAIERDEWGNGAFTKALVEGFSGKAAYNGAERITVNMLDLYISERVKQLTGGSQTPTTTKPKTINDFPVALAR